MKKKQQKKYKPVVLSFDNNSNFEVKSQNSMSDYRNPYEHLNETSFEKKEAEKDNFKILFRGSENHAPQKDLQLGKRSITHKKIAEKLALLVKSSGIEFKVKSDIEESSEEFELALEELEEIDWNEKGFQEAISVTCNGLVHQNISSIVISQKPNFSSRNEAVIPEVLNFQAFPSEWLRYSNLKMNSIGKLVNDWHFYHEDWGFRGFNEKCAFVLPQILKIEEYIEKQNELKDDVAFAVKNIDDENSDSEKFVSCAVKMPKGIYDNSYPLPYWKANSSINDIQAEFESSCIRIDYLRNGLHIFAVVNVYSTMYNSTTENDFESADEQWAEDLAIVQQLKGSYNSGRVIVNPLGTDDPNLDGKIEVEKIELSFPVDQVKYFNEEARAAILTAWGVSADLFSITKPEKNNLRSQEGFLELMIKQLQETVRMYQEPCEKRVNWLLSYFGFDYIEAKFKKHDNELFLTVVSDLAKDFMKVNDVRQKLLGLAAYSEEELTEYFLEKSGNANLSTESNQE